MKIQKDMSTYLVLKIELAFSAFFKVMHKSSFNLIY